MRVTINFDIIKARLAHLDRVFMTNRMLDQGLSAVQDFSSSHRGSEFGVRLPDDFNQCPDQSRRQSHVPGQAGRHRFFRSPLPSA